MACRRCPAKDNDPSWSRLAHRLMEAGIRVDTLALAYPWVCSPHCSCPQLYSARPAWALGVPPTALGPLLPSCLSLGLDSYVPRSQGKTLHSQPCLGHSQAMDRLESWCSLCLAPNTVSVWKLLLHCHKLKSLSIHQALTLGGPWFSAYYTYCGT